MNTIILPADQPGSLEQAVVFLQQGALVAFPTDTVYGLGANVNNPEAINSLYIAKGRDASKAIAVLVGKPGDLELITGEMTEAAHRLTEQFWPGPLTLVVPRHPGLPVNLSPRPTIGVRMPDHPVALALLKSAGALAVTSANLSGAESPTSANSVMDQLTGRIAMILDGGITPGGVPSTVVDCTGPKPVILRQGPVSEADIRACLG